MNVIKKKHKLLQDTRISAAYISPPVETHTVWPFIKAKSMKSLGKRLSRVQMSACAQKYRGFYYLKVSAGVHPQPACSCIILNQRDGILLSISVLHSCAGAQPSTRSASTVLSPAVVGSAHILPTFQTYRIPPRRILAPGGGGGGGVAIATSAPRLGVVLHGVCASCEPMQSAILISVPGEDCSSSSWLIHSGGVPTTFHPPPPVSSRSSAKISPASCVSLFKCHRVCECILVEKPCLRLSECFVLFNRKHAMTMISRRGTRRSATVSGYLMCALKENSSSSDLQDWSQPEPR